MVREMKTETGIPQTTVHHILMENLSSISGTTTSIGKNCKQALNVTHSLYAVKISSNSIQ